MITPDQIGAENFTTALTDTQVVILTLLVKQYPVYVQNLGLFGDLAGELALEVATPTVKTQALKAVLTALNNLPEIVVESQGRSSAPSHFSVNENWNALALDVLNIFYDIPAGLLTRQSFALTQKPVQNSLLLTDDMDAVLLNSMLKH